MKVIKLNIYTFGAYKQIKLNIYTLKENIL